MSSGEWVKVAISMTGRCGIEQKKQIGQTYTSALSSLNKTY